MCDCNKKYKYDFKELLNPSNCYTACPACKDCNKKPKKKCTDCTDVVTWTPPVFSCTVPISVRAQICKNGPIVLACLTSIEQIILTSLKTGDYTELRSAVCPGTILTLFLPNKDVLFRSVPGPTPTGLIDNVISKVGGNSNSLTFISTDSVETSSDTSSSYAASFNTDVLITNVYNPFVTTTGVFASFTIAI
jgi:hypothetical protein